MPDFPRRFPFRSRPREEEKSELAGPVLIVRGGRDHGSTVTLEKDLTLFGRARTNDIVIDEPDISSQHAAIRSADSGFWLEAKNSYSTIFVNGQEVEGEGVRLSNNDKIELGAGMKVYWVFRDFGSTVQEEVPDNLG